MDIDDDYSHPIDNIYYICESVPFDDVKIQTEFDTQIEGCECESYCSSDSNCHCLSKLDGPHQNYKTNDSSETILNDYILNSDVPVYECNTQCQCNIRCGNRLVQFGPRKHLDIRLVPDDSKLSKGYGLFTMKPIPKGGFVCEYAGEIISRAEADRRHLYNLKSKKMNYIQCVNEYYGQTERIQTFVDPSVFGNVGRYMNHSCEPNCVLVPVRINSTIPKFCMFAKDFINEGDELTYSYGTLVKDNGIECQCKSKNCRKYLPTEEYK